jgi:tetratricopeptide (TPR) repeat protein
MTAGECKRARDEATTWRSLEPQSPLPSAGLARALHADGAARASVEEVLAGRWTLFPEARRKEEESWDRTLLAVVDGDFARADELAREHDASLQVSADSWDHARPARLRVNLLMEMDRMKEAAKAARVFLDRLAAWSAFPFASDPSLDFYEPLFRAGEITRRDLEAQRVEWTEKEKRRLSEGRTPRDPWLLWAQVHGSFADTREEALDALARAPRDVAMPAPRDGMLVDFAIGKVNALGGRHDDAIPYLERVVGSCHTFERVMLIARARLLLAQAHEAKGNLAAARAGYEKVVETWPKTTPSRTLKRAVERLAALPRTAAP